MKDRERVARRNPTREIDRIGTTNKGERQIELERLIEKNKGREGGLEMGV